jgi:hypothetical protein
MAPSLLPGTLLLAIAITNVVAITITIVAAMLL